MTQAQKWREAHSGIDIDEQALASAGPFPSLFVNDFAAYLDGKGSEREVVTFVKDMARETAWAYGNWQKALRDSDRGKLLADMLNAASAVGDAAQPYAFVQRFIRDYAAANGIVLTTPAATWE